jgi:hypothetical protein
MTTFVIALATMMALSVPAYAHGPDSPWAGSDPIPVYILSSSLTSTNAWSPFNDGSTTMAAVNAAISAWNNQPSRYRFVYSGATNTLSNGQDGRVVILLDTTLATNAWAVTYRSACSALPQYSCGANIRMRDRVYDFAGGHWVYWSVNGVLQSPGDYYWNDFQFGLMHELGHILAQTHVTTGGSPVPTMWHEAKPFYRTTLGRTLETHDVDWINTVQ